MPSARLLGSLPALAIVAIACAPTSPPQRPSAVTAAAALSDTTSTPGDRSSAPASTASPRTTSSPTASSPASPTASPPASPPASSSSSPSPSEPAEVAGITAAHNRPRAELGLGPLVWSAPLAAVASEWAQRLAARGCGLQHRSDGRYGENLYAIFGTAATADEVVSSWVSEAANYDYKKDRCKGVCGHYTQVVWRRSTKLGCARARCGEGEVWVCNYDPPGNFVGERPY